MVADTLSAMLSPFLARVMPDMEFFALFAGLVGLWLGTEATIRGAVEITLRLRVSEFITGVAILSIGTDLPELTIAVQAARETLHAGQASDVVIGTALGSALGQIGLILGAAGLTAHLTLSKRITYQHGGVLLGSLVLLGLFGLDGQVSRTEGISLVIIGGCAGFFSSCQGNPAVRSRSYPRAVDRLRCDKDSKPMNYFTR